MKNGNIFQIGENTIPIIRAGYSNFSIFVGACFMILLNQAVLEFHVPNEIRYVTILMVGIVFVSMYLTAISKINKSEREYEITKAITTVNIAIATIRSVKVFSLPSSKFGVIVINSDQRMLPYVFHFIAVKSSFGNHDDTIKKLKDFFKNQ